MKKDLRKISKTSPICISCNKEMILLLGAPDGGPFKYLLFMCRNCGQLRKITETEINIFWMKAKDLIKFIKTNNLEEAEVIIQLDDIETGCDVRKRILEDAHACIGDGSIHTKIFHTNYLFISNAFKCNHPIPHFSESWNCEYKDNRRKNE